MYRKVPPSMQRGVSCILNYVATYFQQNSCSASWKLYYCCSTHALLYMYMYACVYSTLRSMPSLSLSQAKALLTDDYGKDLATVEALIRKHEELERDISAIDAKLEVCWWNKDRVEICMHNSYICIYSGLRTPHTHVATNTTTYTHAAIYRGTPQIPPMQLYTEAHHT